MMNNESNSVLPTFHVHFQHHLSEKVLDAQTTIKLDYTVNPVFELCFRSWIACELFSVHKYGSLNQFPTVSKT